MQLWTWKLHRVLCFYVSADATGALECCWVLILVLSAVANTNNSDDYADRLFSSWRENYIVFYVSADGAGAFECCWVLMLMLSAGANTNTDNIND